MTYRLIGMAREKGFRIKRHEQNHQMVNLAEKMIANPRKRLLARRKNEQSMHLNAFF